MMNMLADSGKDVHPWTDGPVVRAIDIEIVRAEFYKSHVADGKTAEKKQAAHRQAFHRAVRTAQEKNLIGVREIEGSKMIWLAAACAG
jgi:hypothetical protein